VFIVTIVRTSNIALRSVINNVRKSRDWSLGLKPTLPAGRPSNRDSIQGRDKRSVCSPQRPDRLWVPPSLLYNGCRGPFPPGVKRPGCGADSSPQSCAEVKNGGAIPPLRHTLSWHGA
jgi:hypothetical protein